MVRIDRIKLVTELAKRDWLIKDVAKRAGLSRATVGNVRHGKSCSPETGAAIAAALGMELAELLEESKC